MCQSKFWMKVTIQEITEDRHKSVISILAERSDLELITIELELDGNDSLGNISSKVKRAIDSLESYRTCDCSVKTGTCIKHLDKINILDTQWAKSEVTFTEGRR